MTQTTSEEPLAGQRKGTTRMAQDNLKATYEQEAVHQSWESAYRDNPLQNRLNAAMLDRILRTIAPPPEARFLDAGCGVGAHTIAIAQRGFDCTGVDISETILKTTRENIAAAGLSARARAECRSLESLGFPDGTFDVVHCRGVLMHIPQWERALAELIRVLKPGGHLVLFEANTQAVETTLARAARWVRKPVSRVELTPGGIESWAEQDGQPFLVRIANIAFLRTRLDSLGVEFQQRWASEFWDVYRFRAGLIRNTVIRFNALWFHCRLPARFSMGNILIGRKRPSSV